VSPLVDAAGRQHDVFAGEPRILSLVPSITELVCELGLTANLIGRTGFCIHPKAALRDIPKVGGTKDVDIGKVRQLAPTHVIVNIDENNKDTADALAGFVPNLIVTHPLAPIDNVALYRLLGGIFRRNTEAESLVSKFTAAFQRTAIASADVQRRSVLYLIWRPWMTVSRDTYISRTLAVIGLDTVPAEAIERYPKIDLEAEAKHAEIVLLSTEPYSFRDKHVAELKAMPALAGKQVHLIDGEMTSWYGPRAIAGMEYLGALRQRLDAEFKT
jgi:ABC-type Fe3+-hydroxamate transport system substrate-binding protein